MCWFWGQLSWVLCNVRVTLIFLLLLFSHQVVSDSLQPHGLQHARLSCPSPSPGVFPSSYPLNLWCHPTISTSVTLFFFCLQSFPASGSFSMSQVFFAPGGQSIGASASVLPKSIHGWFLLYGLVGSPCCPEDSQESSPAPQLKSMNSSMLCLLYDPALKSVHDSWRDQSLDYMDLLSAKWCICCLKHFFPAKNQWSSNFMATVTICSDFRAQEEEICPYFHLFPYYLPWSDGTKCHDFSFCLCVYFLILHFKLAFLLSSFTLIKRLIISSSLSAIRVVSYACLRLLIFLLVILIPACNSSSLAFCRMCCV